MSSDPTRHRWDLFEQAWGDRARAADADWSRGLSADERMTIVDDLFSTIRTARQGDGEWASIDAHAWAETRAERDRFVTAFRRFDESRRGTGSPPNTR